MREVDMAKTRKLASACGALVLAVLACGGQTTSGNDGGGGGDGGPTGGACPAQSPTDGSACAKEGMSCDYGDNPRCLGNATCTGGKWLVAQVKCAPTDPTCPATREAAAGQMCATKNAYCNYAGLTCDCTNCTKYPIVQCMGPLTWVCDAPNTTPGCPPARPNVGQACTKDGLFCDYGCERNVSRQCTGGSWVTASSPYGCPASTREVKKDIKYLEPSDRARVADEARGLKLATWHYKDPALADRERLGVILEDAPMSPSSDMEKKQVDLYAYTSMVLALAQQQDQEIKELRAKVAELEKRAAPAKPAKAK
jgi:hypothetical protein